MKVAVYESPGEVIILPVDKNNNPIDVDDWFEEDGRQIEDYNFNVISLPMNIVSSVRVDHCSG